MTGRRNRRSPAGGLHEAGGGPVELGGPLQIFEADGGERGVPEAQAHGRGPHDAPGFIVVAAVDYSAIHHLDPGGQAIGEPEPVAGPQVLDAIETVGRRAGRSG